MNTFQSSFQFPEVRVVEASAGSGKTFALSRRYVQLVLSSDRGPGQEMPVRTILAITFMKKASFEMKQRILAFLKGLALQTMPKTIAEEILAPVGLDFETASVRAFEVMDDLIHHYNFFQVQTIDSFINALLSGCAFKIGLSSRFRIQHNAFDYLVYSLDRIIERAAHDPKTETLFLDFLNQYLLLENTGGWFPKKDMLGLLSALYHQRNSYGMEFMVRSFEERVVDQMAAIMELMHRLLECLPEKTHGTFKKSLVQFCGRYKTAFDFDRLSNFFAREQFPMTGKEDAPADTADLWDEIRARITRLAETEAHVLFSPYVAVFKETLQEFQRQAARDDVLFMEELNRRARMLFDEGGVTVEELYYRLAARFRHYLVDEFQDTSRLQWDNLAMMVEEALSTGGSLFYVGDKKQAIYSFRGGDVSLFDELKGRFSYYNLQPEYLTVNYRSSEAVVSFNNMIFSLENLKRFIAIREEKEKEKTKGSRGKKNGFQFEDSDYQRLESAFGHGAQTWLDRGRAGRVRVERVAGERRRERDEWTRGRVISLLRELHARFPWKEIAVLTRKNSEVEQVTGWLMEEGVPVKSERTLSITENSVVGELVSFLTFLNSPMDHMAFARVILGDVFCGIAGLSKDAMHQFLFAQRRGRDKARDAAVYREFRKMYPGEWDRHIAPFFRSVGFYPLYELFVSILREWEVLERFEDQCGFIMQMLEVIRRREEDGCDLVSFLEYFKNPRSEDAFVTVPDLDSVQILTTHKAKGLEFKAVILPFAAMEIQVGNRGGAPGEDLGQRSYIMNSDSGAMELLRIKSEYLPYSDPLYRIYGGQAVEALFSELNNIYVSFTRAEEEMHIFIPEKAGQAENLLNLLVPDTDVESGDPGGFDHSPGDPADGEAAAESDQGAGHNESEAVTILPVSHYRDWIGCLNEEFSGDQGELLQRESIRRGKQLHEALGGIGVAQAGLSAPGEQTVSAQGEDDDCARVLTRVLEKEHLRPFFETDGQVFIEKDIVDRNGRSRRVDRMIVKDDEVVVVEYKSARAGGDEHRRQVKDYVDALTEIYPGRRIRGCLIYLDTLDLEEVV